MSNFFSPKTIKPYVKSLEQCDDSLIENINGDLAVNYNALDLVSYLEKCAVQGVCSTLFGMDFTDKRIDEIYTKTSNIFEL